MLQRKAFNFYFVLAMLYKSNVYVQNVYECIMFFFQDSRSYLYKLTGDKKWASDLRRKQELRADMNFFNGFHDLGFIYNNSNGHAYRLQNKPEDLDVLLASVVASALLQLDKFSLKDYKKKAEEILESLSSKKYLAELGENHNFLIKHFTGSIPHNEAIDVPLNYSDYYILEPQYRLKNFNSGLIQ